MVNTLSKLHKILMVTIIALSIGLALQSCSYADTIDHTGYEELPEEYFGYTQLYYDSYFYDLDKEYHVLKLKFNDRDVFVTFKYYLDYSDLDKYTSENTVYMYDFETDILIIFDKVTQEMYFNDLEL